MSADQNNSVAQQVQHALDAGVPVPADAVRLWSLEKDDAVSGLLAALVLRIPGVVDPPLTFGEVLSILGEAFKSGVNRGKEYNEELSLGDLGSAILTRLRREIEEKDPIVRNAQIDRFKMWCEVLVQLGAVYRDALVNYILEHAFECDRVAEQFSDWMDHPALREPYIAATAWARELILLRECAVNVAKYVVARLAAQDGVNPVVESPAGISDGAAVRWSTGDGVSRRLTIACAFSTATMMAGMTDADRDQANQLLAVNAADARNWTQDEFVDWQWNVTVQLEDDK